MADVAGTSPTDRELVASVRQRSRRLAATGAAIAIAVDVLIVVALLVLLGSGTVSQGDSVFVIALLVELAAFPAIGASAGLMVAVRPLTGRLAAIAGAGRGRQAQRDIAHDRTRADPAEQRRLVRYAALFADAVRLQILQISVFYAGLLATQVGTVLRSSTDVSLHRFTVGLIAALALTAAILFPLQYRSARRAQGYAERHGPDRHQQPEHPPAQQESW